MTAVNGLRERVVQVAGIRTPLLEAGPSSAAEAVVFVHGNPGSGRDWQELLRSVGEFARAVALDMPGFDKADKPDDFNYTVAGYACHLAECLTYLGISRVHLVLHDFGGPWGLEWAVANRAAFATAVLINTGVWLDYQWHIYARLWRTPILGELLMASVTRRGFHFVVRRTIPPRLPRRVVDRWFDDYDWGTRRAILRLYRATDDPSRLGYEYASGLRPLARPALVIWGHATAICRCGWLNGSAMLSQLPALLSSTRAVISRSSTLQLRCKTRWCRLSASTWAVNVPHEHRG